MNPIVSSLHDSVTPKVLDAVRTHEGTDDAKKSALTTIYSLALAQLSDVATDNKLTATGLGDNAMATLLNDDVVTTSTLSSAVATSNALPISTVDALTETALPLTYEYIKTAAGTQSVSQYLAPERDSLVSSLPTWLVSLLPAGLLGATSAATAPVSETVTTAKEGILVKEEKPSGSFIKAVLPIIGFLILALLAWLALKGCQKDAAPIAAPVATEVTPIAPIVLSPATFSLALNETGNSVFACVANVGNAGLGQTLNNHVNTAFGMSSCTINTADSLDGTMAAEPYLPQILAVMQGMPDASVNIVGQTILVNASDVAAVQDLVDKIIAIVPDTFVVEAEPQLNEAEAIAHSITASNEALEISTTIDALIHALNLQIINFAVDSTEIPAENQAILDKAALRLKELPDAHLVITGHTDNNGSHAYNQDLSERRAQAVHDYLVAQGVNDEKLDTQGASYDRPIATNATEQGRFRNRRIEFTLMQDGETLTTVGDTAENSATTDSADGATTDNSAENAENTATSN